MLCELPSFPSFFPSLHSPKDASSPPLELAAPGLEKVSAHMNPLGELQASQQVEVWMHEL